MYDYHADDLVEEELRYELNLRDVAIPHDTPIESMKRSLRAWLKHDKTNKIEYIPKLTFDQDYHAIKIELATISTLLALRPDQKLRSRLVHLKYRILRSKTQNRVQERQAFLQDAEGLLHVYFIKPNRAPRPGQVIQANPIQTPSTSQQQQNPQNLNQFQNQPSNHIQTLNQNLNQMNQGLEQITDEGWNHQQLEQIRQELSNHNVIQTVNMTGNEGNEANISGSSSFANLPQSFWSQIADQTETTQIQKPTNNRADTNLATGNVDIIRRTRLWSGAYNIQFGPVPSNSSRLSF